MTPGLARGPPFPSKAVKNAIVAVASLDKPSVPMVVGVCEIDIASLGRVQGAKGHAVRGEHWDGDELWAWSPSGKPGESAPEDIEGWDTGSNDEVSRQGVERLTVDDADEDLEEGGVSLGTEVDQPTKFVPPAEHVEGEDTRPYEVVEEREISTKGSGLAGVRPGLKLTYLQKLTTHSGTPSCSPCITTLKPTKAIHVKA